MKITDTDDLVKQIAPDKTLIWTGTKPALNSRQPKEKHNEDCSSATRGQIL